MAQPSEGGWSFTGDAGVYRPMHSAVPGFASKIFRAGSAWPGFEEVKKIQQNSKTALGCKFKVGDKPVYVRQFGRVFTQSAEGAKFHIIRESDKTEVASSERDKVAGFLVKFWGYYFGKPLEKPVRLEPNTVYYLMSTSGEGKSLSAAADDIPIKDSGPGITILNGAKAKMDAGATPASWQFSDGKPGGVFGPLTFLYSMDENSSTKLPVPPFGQQAGIIKGNGSMSTQVNFAKAGEYALAFCGQGAGSKFQIFVDDINASPRTQVDYRASGPEGAAGLGGFNRNGGFKEEWGSAVFKIEKPGMHTLKFAGSGKPDSYVVLDDIKIASMDAIMDSGFGAGSALGQPVENAWGDKQITDSALVQSYGLPRVSYETGWSLGGDFYQKPIQNYAKFSSRAQDINDKAVEILQRSGCRNPVWGVYIYWPPDDFTNGRTYPIMKSFINSSNRLPAEVDNGLPIPATLTAENALVWKGKNTPELSGPGKFLSWTVCTPKTGNYSITVTTAGDGKFDMELNGEKAGDPVAWGTPSEWKGKLPKGVVGIRVRNAAGNGSVQKVEIRSAD